MADYTSLKVPELKKLLTERKLPQTGNKADLIARLQEEDGKSAAADAEAKPVAAKDDEITYSDDEGAKKAAAAAAAAPVVSQDDTAAAAAADADADADASADAPKNGMTEASKQTVDDEAETAAPAPSFSIGLSSSVADEEVKKRAERAKRFGGDENGSGDEDAKKRAERAKRFGLDKDVSGLDSALPERSLKRGRGHQQDGQRAGKRQSTGRGGDRRQGRQGQAGGRGPPSARGSGVLDDPAEKAKAEKRAARFAAA